MPQKTCSRAPGTLKPAYYQERMSRWLILLLRLAATSYRSQLRQYALAKVQCIDTARVHAEHPGLAA